MRDPERIKDVLEELERFWRKQDQLRLGQVIALASYGTMRTFDSFYLEDDKLLEWLRNAHANG